MTRAPKRPRDVKRLAKTTAYTATEGEPKETKAAVRARKAGTTGGQSRQRQRQGGVRDTVERATHLEWLVEHRSKNQQQSLRLFCLLDQYRGILEKADTDQGVLHFLISVIFSLWRAVFLGEIDENRLLDHAGDFLKNLIEHNSVSYQSDLKTKAYTFGYYITMAAQSLQALHEKRRDIVPRPIATNGMGPTAEWEYLHGITAKAITAYGKRLEGRAEAIEI